jgi:hypothetical protein
MVTSLTISKQVFLSNLNAGLTYPLDTYAAFGYTVTSVEQIQTSSGTVTAALQINGTNITGLSSISVSSTPQNVTASGANTVSTGNALTLVFSSNSAATNIQFTLVATRTAVSSVSNSDGTLTISPTAGDVVASLASAPTVTGQMTAASFAPSTTSGIIGTTTNNHAAAGSVGEYISSSVTSGSAVSLTTNTVANVTSISLTAGDWDVSGSVGFVFTSSTSYYEIQGGINTTSATLPDFSSGALFTQVFANYAIPGATNQGFPVGRTRISVSSTTTVYLLAKAEFNASTLSAYGLLAARRVR